MAFWPAAVLDGVLFGFTHGVSTVLPVLIFLGVVFCFVYERTGTIFATIALHALNNAISYGATTTHGWAVSLPAGALVITGCAVAAARVPRRGALAPA
jgi:membrane protease YdiL (CAAX protease family)